MFVNFINNNHTQEKEKKTFFTNKIFIRKNEAFVPLFIFLKLLDKRKFLQFLLILITDFYFDHN